MRQDDGELAEDEGRAGRGERGAMALMMRLGRYARGAARPRRAMKSVKPAELERVSRLDHRFLLLTGPDDATMKKGAGWLIARDPRLSTGALLAITVWAACRFYYFCFYVLEQYAGRGTRYRGLVDALGYLLGRQRER